MKKRLPSTMTTEELLKQLEEAEDTNELLSETEYVNDVLGFLNFFKIKNGNNYISKRKLFKIYRKWSKKPITATSFGNEVTSYIKNDTKGYYINMKAMELSASAYKELTLEKKYSKLKNPKYQEQFQSFLQKFELAKGNQWVPGFVLYFLYDKWTYETDKITMISTFFNAFCELHFEGKFSKSDIKWYKVNDKIFNHIPPEQMLSIMEAREKSAVRKKRKKVESKIEVEVSSPGPRFKPKNTV